MKRNYNPVEEREGRVIKVTQATWTVEIAARLMPTYDVVGEDVGATFEVDNGAGDFQDTA